MKQSILILLVYSINNLLIGQTIENEFLPEASSYEKFGISVEEKYLWLENDSLKKTIEWHKKQAIEKSEFVKKSNLNKYSWSGYFVSSLEDKSSQNFDFRVKQLGEKPAVVQYKPKNENTFKTLLKLSDFIKSDSDFPTVENYWVDPSERYVIIAVSHSGTDWIDLMVYDRVRQMHSYTLEGVIKPSILFFKEGFVYEKYDLPNNILRGIRKNQRLSYHQFGQSQKNEKVIFQNPDKEFNRTFSWMTLGKDVLCIFHPIKFDQKWKDAISILELAGEPIPKPFLIYESQFKVDFDPIFRDGNEILFRTNLLSPNFEILAFQIDDLNSYKSFIPEYSEVLTEARYLGNGYFGLTYLNYGKYSGLIINKEKNVNVSLQVPDESKLTFLNYSAETNSVRYKQSYYHLSPKYWSLNLSSRIATPEHDNYAVYRENYGKAYEVKSLIYNSRDGNRIPLLVVYDANKTKKDKPNPTMLYVYAGYGTILEPHNSLELSAFIRNGGILAVPGVRGGGSLGTKWALDGQGLNKQNTINDLIDAVQFLIDNNYTDSDNLVINGTSHGAFIATAAAIQRPDLFRGVIASKPPMDLIRNSQFSVGYDELNWLEFGNPNDSISFKNLHNLSPIHNLKEGVNYPSFLLIVGSNDTRVPPSQVYRFKALLDDYSTNQLNILHITRFGHGSEAARKEYFQTLSLKFHFWYLLTGDKFWK